MVMNKSSNFVTFEETVNCLNLACVNLKLIYDELLHSHKEESFSLIVTLVN